MVLKSLWVLLGARSTLQPKIAIDLSASSSDDAVPLAVSASIRQTMIGKMRRVANRICLQLVCRVVCLPFLSAPARQGETTLQSHRYTSDVSVR